MGGFRDKYL